MSIAAHSIIRNVKSCLIGTLTRLGLRICKLLIDKNNPKISLSIDAELLEDGLGAQIQRQLSLKALAHFLNIEFIPTPIRQIAIHPLDNFKGLNEMWDFLNQVNDLFGFKTERNPIIHKLIRVRILTIGELFRLILLSRIMSRNLQVQVLEAYSLVDVDPRIYADSLSGFKLNMASLRSDHQLPESEICIHYRQGTGGNVIYPGQKISRELNPQYFIDLLNQIETDGKTITVFTDAPIQDIEFKPDISQEHLWKGTPGYENGKVRIQGLDLKSIFAKEGYEITVLSGGDLITTLLAFINCKTLLMSRSSLSYVGALLNNNSKIYYPPNFWHPPLNSWVKVK